MNNWDFQKDENINVKDTPTMDQWEDFEEEVQILKWKFYSLLRRAERQTENPTIVEETAGVLGSSFQTGLEFQKKARKQWEKREAKL